MSEFPESNLYNRVKQLQLPAESLVVVGEGALEAVVGPSVHRAETIHLTATTDAFQSLWQRPDLLRTTLPDGSRLLTGSGYNVTEHWNGRSAADLQRRGYVNQDVAIAGLPDLYEHAQNSHTPAGDHTLELIRNRLYSKHVLPEAVVAGELAFVQSCMPEHLRDRPELIIGANGLYIVRTVFGDYGESGARRYGGPGQAERDVAATQHAWEHTAFGIKAGQINIDAVNNRCQSQGRAAVYDEDDRVDGVNAYGNHDSIMGHGRQFVLNRQGVLVPNPEPYDERRAGEHVASQYEAMGLPDQRTEAVYVSVLATAFNEQKMTQGVEPTRGFIPLQHLTSGADLAPIFRSPLASSNALRLCIENMTREGAGFDRPLGKLLDILNSSRPADTPPYAIITPEDGMALIDQYPDFPVTQTVGGKQITLTLRQAVADFMRSSAKFAGSYKAPEYWIIGDPEAPGQNVAYMNAAADRIEAGGSMVKEFRDRIAFEATHAPQTAVGAMPGGEKNRLSPVPLTGRPGEVSVTQPSESLQGIKAIQDKLREIAELPADSLSRARQLLGEVQLIHQAILSESTTDERAKRLRELVGETELLLAGIEEGVTTFKEKLEHYARSMDNLSA